MRNPASRRNRPVEAAPVARGPSAPAAPFDAARARSALPLVRQIVRDIVETWGEIVSEVEATEVGDRGSAELALEDVAPRLDGLAERLDELVKELSQLGVYLRDLEEGWIDFPAQVAGRPAFIPWRLGDEAVTHYYHAGEGYERRRPLAEVC